MIVEQRTYTLVPGKVRAYFELYEREGMATQEKHLGAMLGYYATEVGPLNQVLHLWGYRDLNDRMQRRETLFADPLWLAYVAKLPPFLVTQESRILVPAPFFSARQ